MVEDRTPDRHQARILVASAGSFWAAWAGVAAGGEAGIDGLVLPAAAIAMGSGFLLYRTLSGVWGLPMYSFRFARGRWRAMTKLLDPPWLWRTVRATDWPPYLVAGVLLGLLALDLVLFGLVLTHSPTVLRG